MQFPLVVSTGPRYASVNLGPIIVSSSTDDQLPLRWELGKTVARPWLRKTWDVAKVDLNFKVYA